MKLLIKEIHKSLSKAYLKQDLTREQINNFKTNLKTLFKKAEIAEQKKEHEEHFKNIISEFLKDTFYKNEYEININKRKDLVIHNGKSSSDTIGVIIEAKKPSNESEMITLRSPNSKALHELLHYYMQERFINDNKEIKHIIATNSYDWFIFDAADFERFFYNDKKLRENYDKWNRGFLVNANTNWFYDEVAKPYIEKELSELEVVHFNLLNYKKIVENSELDDDINLIELYKILSPEHLLKKTFANDSNTLNKDFYNELLHIIGLEEKPDSGKKLITTKKPESREDGSLIENAINIIKTRNKLNSLSNPEQFGKTEEEQLFSIGLELCITWLNRILFLKLLEGQLIKYHNGNLEYSFINSKSIKDFDELDELFFEVLAIKPAERSKSVNEKFGSIPYLNSSLFEISELESKTIQISDLKDRLELSLHSHSVLKNKDENKHTEKKNTLHYLFEFLSAYKFSSDSSATIQEDNKTIINASVLGLIFEKINGYKDGSFFTPGFITMYMCRETIREVVVNRFKEQENKEIDSFDNLKNYCARFFKKDDINRFNNFIDTIKICDPAVGSGHFLVSALNEIIAIKSELNILVDSEGTPLEYEVTVDNDELTIISKKTNKLYEYILGSDNKPPKALQQVQVTLFNEKQKIIENCLFGVDLNPKSVLICRLRLWIELLKNAYYKPDNFTELETLPNIDINIKCGNSLISKFNLIDSVESGSGRRKGSQTTSSLKFAQITKNYKESVILYKVANSKSIRDNALKAIKDIKERFSEISSPNDKLYIELQAKKNELIAKQSDMYAATNHKVWSEEIEKLSKEVAEIDQRFKEKQKLIYSNSFEWRFEFPEVLSNDGLFEGFDLVIGNPPYLNFKMYSQAEREVFKNDFRDIFDGKADIYYFFFFQGLRALKQNGIISYITSRYWLEAEFAEKLRKVLSNNYCIKEIIDFKNVTIFDGIGIKTAIATLQNNTPSNGSSFSYKFIDSKKIKSVEIESFTTQSIKNDEIRTKAKWVFGEESELDIYKKIENGSVLLESIAECKQGILTGFDKAFVVSNEISLELEKEILKPWLKVGDVFKYYFNIREKRSVIYPNEIKDINKYPKLLTHLLKFKPRLENREEALKGNYRWFDLHRPRKSELFNSAKLICRYKASHNTFALDVNKYYSSADTTIVVLKNEFAEEYDLKFILALVNSKLLDFYFKSYGKLMDYRFEYYPGPVGQLRIKKAKNQKEFVAIVDKIIEAKTKDHQADTSELEKVIDQMVYNLYDITEDEQKIINGE